MSKPIAIPRDFSLAFNRMCNFVAISNTRSSKDTIKELVLQCFVIFPTEDFSKPATLGQLINDTFGLQIPDHQIEAAVYSLKQSETILNVSGRPAVNVYIRSQLQTKIQEASALEQEIKAAWLKLIATALPGIDTAKIWTALQSFLAVMFQRHGMQTISMLDPTFEFDFSKTESLGRVREAHLKRIYHSSQEIDRANQAFALFFAALPRDPRFTKYIIQLADGAFNYYSLAVDPAVAEQFRKRLYPLTLFFDTNVLYGILDFHENPITASAIDLVRAVEEFKLSIKMRYHTATQKEARTSINGFAGLLRARKWTRELSRAAISSPHISGVEKKFHGLNAATPLEVNQFLKPLEYFEELLKEKKIEVYRPGEDRVEHRLPLYHEYNEYLKGHGRTKSYEMVDHDAAVLDAVQNLRSNSTSPLEAGALLVTADFTLYRFDWEKSRRDGTLPCTVLPSVLWQLMRPFIPTGNSFDASFAAAFSLPEFRSFGGGASQAGSKLLGLLATYKDFPEETAKKLLTNDLLISSLKATREDAQIRALVESAIANENAALSTELKTLQHQVLALTTSQEKMVSRDELKASNEEQEKLKSEIQRLTEERLGLEKSAADRDRAAQSSAMSAEKWRRAFIVIVLVLVFSGLNFIALGTERIPWVFNHPNRLSIVGLVDLLLIFVGAGFWEPRYRRWAWSAGVLVGILIAIAQSLPRPPEAKEPIPNRQIDLPALPLTPADPIRPKFK